MLGVEGAYGSQAAIRTPFMNSEKHAGVDTYCISSASIDQGGCAGTPDNFLLSLGLFTELTGCRRSSPVVGRCRWLLLPPVVAHYRKNNCNSASTSIDASLGHTQLSFCQLPLITPHRPHRTGHRTLVEEGESSG